MYEYKFVRLEFGGTLSQHIKGDYQQIIHDHAAQGWRLVQIFAPQIGSRVLYHEIIFERPKPEAP